MVGIYYLRKKYETIGSIEKKKRRDRKPKTSTREVSMNIRFAQKKNNISSREIEKKLEIECVRSISFPYNQNPRVENLHPKKKTIYFKTKHGNELAFAKGHFSKVLQLWDSILSSYKSKYDLFG
ncbi:hypothetical protein AVEN_1316-1 [Araneus ventricosus]|uniref:Uncharacterized protein n=1 Tax=Araneus ventricosus TaxID=182803 RepID=A0A4Y2D3U5_ARAVE|nr:hypothetical protein AVEN_1316-1 [Araneus ventricosus]